MGLLIRTFYYAGVDILAKTDTYPRAKAMVVQAKIENPELSGSKALEMLEGREKQELMQVKTGEKLADPVIGFPLEVPTNAKTCSRWIAEIPKMSTWEGSTATPEEFRVIARVIRELAASKTLTRMLTQTEAENIARFGLIAPLTPPLTLLALAQLAIAVRGNEQANSAITSWLVYSVDDLKDRSDYLVRDWTDIYNGMAGKAFPDMPDLYVDIYKMNELLPILKEGNDG
jgi:hypothetical protein